MSFLKSYYNSVSSFLNGEEETNDIHIDNNECEKVEIKESKSEGWLKGIYNGAYNQSGELWKAVKTDLTEFATVISKDAKVVMVKTAAGVKNGLVGSEENLEPENAENTSENSQSSTSKLRSGINRFLDQVSKALYIPPESDDEDYGYGDNEESQTICNRIDSRILILQRNRSTFETDPCLMEIDQDLGNFTEWRDKLNLDDFQPSIAELVNNNSYIFDHYAELVPRCLTHDEFWSRYFYRVASIHAEESRREVLKLRISHDVKTTVDADSCDWDEGNDVYEESTTLTKSDVVEVSAVEQTTDTEPNQILPTKVSVGSDNSLKFKEKDDVIVVKHSVESSSASEDNNLEMYSSIDRKGVDDDIGWDDEIDLDVNEEDIELAANMSETEVMETKWDDWS